MKRTIGAVAAIVLLAGAVMLAAAGKLVVVTREGRIYTFGETPPDAVVEHRPPRMPDPAADEWTEQVAHLLQATKAADGFAVVLGIEGAELGQIPIEHGDMRLETDGHHRGVGT